LRISVYQQEPKNDLGRVVSAAPIRLFHYGERLRFPARISLPRNYRNPGAFDYRGYLAENGIVALASTKAASVEVLPGFAGSRAELWRSRIHRSVIDKVHDLWPPRQAALMDAMVIGEDAFINRPTRADFQRSGTYHVLVVSGMNVSILALVTFWFLRRLRISDLVAGAITVSLMVPYALLTALGSPVWRATLMLALYLGARLLYREKSMLNAIGAAALGLMIANPQVLFGASFQLTFLCVWLVAAVGIPILERTTQPFIRASRHIDSQSYDFVLPAKVVQYRLDLRMIAGRLQCFAGHRMPLRALAASSRALMGAGELLLISIVMQIGLALPNGVLLPSRHRGGIARQHAGGHGTSDACRSCGHDARIRFANSGQDTGADRRRCTRRHSGHSAMAGRIASGGSARAHARDHRDFDDCPVDHLGHGFGSPPSLAGGSWIGRVGRQCILDFCGPAASADSARCAGDDSN
jgi:competence protein ComEC